MPVAGDCRFTIRFRSSLDQTSADREPWEVVATTDQPPSLVVEKPSQDVTLPDLQPLAVAARALDDWGVVAVGLRIGPSAGEMSSPRWTETDGELPTSRSIFLAIDPRAEQLKAGNSLTYCLVAKDSKGQVTESQPYKLSIAAPDKVAAADTARPPASLDNLLQALHQAATAPAMTMPRRSSWLACRRRCERLSTPQGGSAAPTEN